MKKEINDFSWLDVVKSVWYFLEEDKAKFTFFTVILTIAFFYELVPAYIIGRIVDFFSSYKTGQSLSTFYFYVIFVSSTWIIVSLIRLKSKNILSIISFHARARARILGFTRLTEFSLEWHNKENTGSKLQRIFTGADALNGWIKIFRHDLLQFFASITGVIFFFSFTNTRFIILALAYSIIFLAIESYFTKRNFILSNESNKLNQLAGGTYVESASNMLSIKALGGEKGVKDKVYDKETLTRDMSIKKTNLNNLKWRIFQFLNGLVLLCFLIFIGQTFVSKIITIGMILILYSYLNRLQGALSGIDDLYTDMIDLRSAVAQMMPIFYETDYIKTGSDPFPKNWDMIEVKNATMDYGSGQMGLDNFSLKLKRNTKTGIAGLSGSGKSTLAKIILGLYALKKGELKIGNKNYYSLSHNETLSHITVVLQETELFNLSLRENITMMRSEDAKLLNQAIEISQLKEVIERLPEGLDAKIGEKGYMLSGGERQRLGIARAIYKNAGIIILDEATSSLDSETEGKIMQKLLGEYGKDKTFLIIAHRLGTLRYTDNIAVMERGKVVEEGNYDKLMNNSSSVFYEMNSFKAPNTKNGKK